MVEVLLDTTCGYRAEVNRGAKTRFVKPVRWSPTFSLHTEIQEKDPVFRLTLSAMFDGS